MFLKNRKLYSCDISDSMLFSLFVDKAESEHLEVISVAVPEQ